MPATLPDRRTQPTLATTSHDKVSAGMMSVIVGLVLVLAALVVVVAPRQTETPDTPVAIELVEVPHSENENDVVVLASLEFSEDESPDVEFAEAESESVKIDEKLETIVELSEATRRKIDSNTGNAGASTELKAQVGATRDFGPSRMRGPIPRHQRWFIKFSEGSLENYAKQIDHFRIELGALMADGKFVLLTDVSKQQPAIREAAGIEEKRLYMTWRGGEREQSDRELFARAGIDASEATILHFYSEELESELARIEFDYRKKKPRDIRRTFFRVVRQTSGFAFLVASQSYRR